MAKSSIEAIFGWATWKGRSPYDLCLHRTKRRVLIGYDMMALIGLRRMERRLNSQGVEVVRTSVEPSAASRRHCFCLSIAGKLDSGSLEWSINNQGGGIWGVCDPRGHELLSFVSACGYVSQDDTPIHQEMDTEERKNLLGIWWHADLDYSDPSQPRDKRKRSTHERVFSKARCTFERLNIELTPVRFSRVARGNT